jgi:hypothetical protein
MKGFFAFILGLAIGALAIHLYEHRNSEGTGAIDSRLLEWHLSGPEVSADLARTGEVIRERARVAGVMINDARIVSVIKAKFLLDRELSAAEIHVESKDGQVTLSGSVAEPDLVGKAAALALDTDGVSHVDSKLSVQAKP